MSESTLSTHNIVRITSRRYREPHHSGGGWIELTLHTADDVCRYRVVAHLEADLTEVEQLPELEVTV